MWRILFLDVDGVLNGPDQIGLCPLRVQLLNTFLLEVRADIVLNSAWNIHPLEETREQFYAAGMSCMNQLIGTTPGSQGGGEAIRRWCRANNAQEAQIAILDDSPRGMGGLWSRLTWVDPRGPLTEEHMDHLAGTFCCRSVTGNVRRMIRNRDAYLNAPERTWLTESQRASMRQSVQDETRLTEGVAGESNWLAYLLR